METLYALFGATFDADPNKRKAAELEIRKLEAQEGVLAAAFQIVLSEQADLAVRQAAVIYVKNRVRRTWDLSRGQRSAASGTPSIGDSDRRALKAGLLQALASVPERLRVHVQETLLSVITVDFPNAWPELMPQIGTFLQSGEAANVHAGVRALLQVVAAFRWKDEAGISESIISSSFPALLTTAKALLESPNASAPASGSILHAIFKTYARSMQSRLSQHQRSQDSIVGWGMLLLQVVQKEVDPSQLPEDADERERAPWWKAKKWAFYCLNRLFSKYGSPSQLPSTMAEYKPFAEGFVARFAPEILKVYIRLTEAHAQQGVWLSKRATVSLFRFYDDCVRPKTTWQLLKPHVNMIIQNFAFPLFCFSEADAEAFEDDPIEYIRSQLDIFEEATLPAGSAGMFIETVVSKRKATFLPQLQFVQEVMQSHALGQGRTAQEKEGAMRLASALTVMLVNSPQTSKQMDQFFAAYVVPELKSPHNFLRFRACDLIKTFDKRGMEWQSAATLEAAFRGVMECLLDKELPVRVQAASALGELIAHDEIRDVMASNAGRLMQELLKLSDETDLDVLMTTQEKVVETFSEELIPFAVELTTQLRDSYVRMVHELAAVATLAEQSQGTADIGEKSAEDKMFAAMGNLGTMYQMISAAETKPDILAQVEEIVLPAITLTLEKQMLELVDDVFDLTDMLTFYQKKISPGMWKLYELMHASFMAWAADYLDNMISTLDNFVSFGADVFRSNAQYRRMLGEIFATATHSPKLGPMDHLAAYKLADVMLLVLKGCWDQELSGIIETVLPNATAAPKSNDAKLRKWAEVVILDALIYNAPLTLQILEAKGATGAVLDAIASRTEAYTRVHECRACICAFINLLALGPANMPQSVQERAPKVLGTLVIHLANMPTVVRHRKELTDELEDVSDDEDEDEVGVEVDGEGIDGNFGDDADVRDKETEYMEMLAEEQLKLLRRSAGKTAEGEDDDDEWDEDIDDDDEDDDAVYDSPLDSEPIYEAFRKVMQDLQTAHPDAFTQLTSALPSEQQQALHTVSQMTDKDLLAIAEESDDEE